MKNLAKRIGAVIMVTALTCGLALPAFAETTLDDVLKRVEALEKENAALKSEVLELKDKQSAQESKIASVQAAPAPVAAAVPSVNFVKSKLEVALSGFIKADMAYSDAEAGTTNQESLVIYNAPRNPSKAGNVKQKLGDFNMSGADTRFDVDVKAPEMDKGGKISGRVEFDFANTSVQQAAGSSPSYYTPRLRLAYSQIDYDKWSVTAGHAWDFISPPINTNLFNSANLWRSGNFGYRHPQLFLTNKWGQALGGKWTTKVGVIDSDDLQQENSKTPVFGAYTGYDTKILGTAASFGVGGIYGQSTTDLGGTSSVEGGKSNDIYAVDAGMTLKFTDWLAFKTKGFMGSKLNAFLGGSATGVSNSLSPAGTATPSNTKGIRVMGGFMELTYNPIPKLETNFGMGLDDLMQDKAVEQNIATTRAAVWSTNRSYYTNMKYSLSKDVLVGIEYQYFKTNWLDGMDSSDNRVETSLIYKF